MIPRGGRAPKNIFLNYSVAMKSKGSNTAHLNVLIQCELTHSKTLSGFPTNNTLTDTHLSTVAEKYPMTDEQFHK